MRWGSSPATSPPVQYREEDPRTGVACWLPACVLLGSSWARTCSAPGDTFESVVPVLILVALVLVITCPAGLKRKKLKESQEQPGVRRGGSGAVATASSDEVAPLARTRDRRPHRVPHRDLRRLLRRGAGHHPRGSAGSRPLRQHPADQRGETSWCWWSTSPRRPNDRGLRPDQLAVRLLIAIAHWWAARARACKRLSPSSAHRHRRAGPRRLLPHLTM